MAKNDCPYGAGECPKIADLRDKVEYLETPQSIMDEGNDYYPAETDIFAEIFDTEDFTFTNGDLMQLALWSKYRYFMLGSCCTDKWVRSMADRLMLVGEKWDEIFTKATTSDMTSLDELSYERLIKRTAITGTQGDVRTNKYEHENMPQTASDTTQYLDQRSKNTDTYVPNTQDLETYTEDRDILASTFKRMMQSFPDLLEGFADEFKDYFVERWY